MESITAIYKIGKGPSSSHTMGPEKAARLFLSEHGEADAFRVTLYGSLAKTGHGHGTDRVIREVLGDERTTIIWDETTEDLPHPNTMDFSALRNGTTIANMRAISVGGGNISVEGRQDIRLPDLYAESSFREIAMLCKDRGIRLSDYVLEHEGESLLPFLHHVWSTMLRAIDDGLTVSGTLPGGLGVERKAQYLFQQRHMDESAMTRENRMVCAYAFAVGEQNINGVQNS